MNILKMIQIFDEYKQNQKMKQLRQTMLADTQITASKSRFGLFTQPPTLAVGDDSYSISKIARKGQDGKPITKPRNLLAGSNRSGVTKKDFVTPTSSIYAGDKYVNPQKLQRQFDLKIHSKAQFHQLQFKPSNAHKSIITGPYPHIDEKPIQKKKPMRDADSGRVITQNKNITANAMKKIQTDFFKNLKHIADPYQRKQLFESQQRKISKSKMGQQIFRTMSHGSILFSNDKRIYGEDDKVKELMNSKKKMIETARHSFNHQTQFKLARRGHGDPIGKYPQFILPQQTSKSELVNKIKRERSDKEQWKPNGNKTLSRPTPSISYSSFSLRKYY